MTQRTLPAWIVAACLGAAPALAAADTFLQISGVAGDATDARHRGWIRVLDVDWAVKSSAGWPQIGSTATGKVAPDKLRLTLPLGSWSGELLRFAAKGQYLQGLVIEHLGTDGRLAYRLRPVSVLVAASSIDAPAQQAQQNQIELVFASIRVEHYSYTADGQMLTSVVDWNLVENIVK